MIILRCVTSLVFTPPVRTTCFTTENVVKTSASRARIFLKIYKEKYFRKQYLKVYKSDHK